MTFLPAEITPVTLSDTATAAGFLKGLPENTLFIDALFGTGLNRPLDGEWAALVELLNAHPGEMVSIDIPSGLLADQSTPGGSVIRADRVFSFESPKRAFFFPENEPYTGKWEFGTIGLHADFMNGWDQRSLRNQVRRWLNRRA